MILCATIFFFIEVFSHAYVEFANSRLSIALNVSRHTCCLFQNIREISMNSSSSCVILIFKRITSIKSLWIKYILKLINKNGWCCCWKPGLRRIWKTISDFTWSEQPKQDYRQRCYKGNNLVLFYKEVNLFFIL